MASAEPRTWQGSPVIVTAAPISQMRNRGRERTVDRRSGRTLRPRPPGHSLFFLNRRCVPGWHACPRACTCPNYKTRTASSTWLQNTLPKVSEGGRSQTEPHARPGGGGPARLVGGPGGRPVTFSGALHRGLLQPSPTARSDVTAGGSGWGGSRARWAFEAAPPMTQLPEGST